jgi:LysM repeat protein
MFRKVSVQVLVLILLMLAFFGTPLGAQAGGVCGGTYVVEAGDTADSIAARCGISASAIYAANPGVSSPLQAGQVLILPGGSTIPSTPVPSTPIPPGVITATVNNYNTYNYYNYPAAGSSSNGNYITYIVQPGDTFSSIASRYGLSVGQLWAANPQIWNINYIYAGQVIYIPTWGGAPGNPGQLPAPTETPMPLSYGQVPPGAPHGSVRLVDSTYSDIYISLQGTTRDGVNVIREYPVDGSMTVKVPAAWYVYVAWVGGVKYEGQFSLSNGGDHTITFYNNKVVSE